MVVFIVTVPPGATPGDHPFASGRVTQPISAQDKSPIAGSVFPIQGAEDLIATLQDVISVRVIASPGGGIDAIHVLVTAGTPAKQVVRNIESALMAQLGLQVDHRKISVATTTRRSDADKIDYTAGSSTVVTTPAARPGRPIYFEDVEVRGSRARGITCRVTLSSGDNQYAGEAEEGVQNERSRIDVAARATIAALGAMTNIAGTFSLEGVRVINAFDRDFVFAAILVRHGREQMLLTGTCEMRDSTETASVLAVLDATNRWIVPALEASGVAIR